MINLLRLLTALLILCPALMSAQASADTLDIIKNIERNGRVTLILPEGMSKCLAPQSIAGVAESDNAESEDPQGASQTSVSGTKSNAKVGYRVQVFDDNNVMSAKHDAQARRHLVESRFPEFRTYVQFNSPYWKVKVGDFRTRSEADAAMAAIRAAFPGFASQLRVVRDRINP